MPTDLARLFRALHFAADKHRDQKRKGQRASPYINHPIEVASVLAAAGITDMVTLTAAVLHDTIEDTDTSPEEIEEEFGREVRDLVAEMTDDKKLPKEERKRLQIEHAAKASERAKLIKLADKICNLGDVTHQPPSDWSLERRREYVDWTEQVVKGCRGANARLEALYDEVLAAGRARLREPAGGQTP